MCISPGFKYAECKIFFRAEAAGGYCLFKQIAIVDQLGYHMSSGEE